MLPGSQFITRFTAVEVILPPACWAQFSGSIQGTVQDPAGAVVPNAKVQLKNTGTGVATATTSDAEGNYRFVSLAPGSYQLSVDAPGFNTTAVAFSLETSQNLNVPVAMKVATASQAVEVTGQVPVLNTAESRNQMTLETAGAAKLPPAGRRKILRGTGSPRGGCAGPRCHARV